MTGYFYQLKIFSIQVDSFYITLQKFWVILSENFNTFIFPYAEIIIIVVLFWLLFSRSIKNKSQREYPSFAKELELQGINISDVLASYLDSPAEEEAVVSELAEAIIPKTPAVVEEPSEVVPIIEGERTTTTKKRKKRKAQKAAFVFNAKEGIIYQTILTRKY